MGISLAMSVFNRADLFRRSYPTWFEDKTWPDEILIVNDDSTDDLDSAVAEMSEKYPVPLTYEHVEKPSRHSWKNPAVVHNWLVKEAKYPIVLIIDPEIAFVNDGLPIVYEFFQDEANRSSSCSAGTTYSVQYGFMSAIGELGVDDIVNNPHVSTDPTTHCIILRLPTPAHGYRAWWRQRYIDLGGKDERYEYWGYEDLDLHFRQQRLPPGGKDKTLTEIVIVEFGHPIPDMEGSHVNQALWNSEGSKGIPEDGVANRGIEWGVLE